MTTSMKTKEPCDKHTQNADLRSRGLLAVPSTLFTLERVRRVDLSANQLTRFPGARVSQELPCLEVLLLHNNLLHVLEDIFALSRAPRLCELDARDNPLRLQHNRLYLLEALLSQATGAGEEFLLMTAKDDALKRFGEDTEVALPPSRSMAYRSQLPRRRGFPMLLMLNGEWITDLEIRQLEAERGKPIEYFRLPGLSGSKPHDGRPVKSTVNSRKVQRRGGSLGEGADSSKRRFDGTRMTIKQILRNDARITAIPQPRVLTRFQIDTQSGQEVAQTADDTKQFEEDVIENTDDLTEHELLQQVFHSASPAAVKLESQHSLSNIGGILTTSAGQQLERSEGVEVIEDDEPWNYPISTFDDLLSEERHYVRAKSKQVGGTIERDDHFFESTTFVDCVAQCERSRRLTIRAVDTLKLPRHGGRAAGGLLLSRAHITAQSAPALPTCQSAAKLTDTLAAKFSKHQDRESFELVAAFQQKQMTVNGCHIQAAVGDYFLDEHVVQKQKTNQLLSVQNAGELHFRHNPHAIEASLEESMSKVKLRNAVDLANTLVDYKEEKRMTQALIDADKKVIEEERILEEQNAHRERLRLINARQPCIQPRKPHEIDDTKLRLGMHSDSPWQKRNWRAKVAQLEQKKSTPAAESPTASTTAQAQLIGIKSTTGETSNTSSNNSSEPVTETLTTASTHLMGRFRDIETVEKATQDPLVTVNSHDLLVRCSEIRQHKDRHMRALALYRDRFLEDEDEWEQMRQDPINVVRRHLRRKLYQDTQQIQIGSTDYFYSPLFE